MIAIATYSSLAVVTNRFSSAAVQLVSVTATAVETETVTLTETNTVTDTQQATITQTATLTTDDVATATMTTTSTSEAITAPINKRRSDGLPQALQGYSTEELLDACWCVEFETVTVTATLAPTTQIQTIVIASTVPSSVTTISTSTMDLTTTYTQLSTVTTTTTITEQDTMYATADQTVTVTATATTTVTPVPTNILVNPGFTGGTISPWVASTDKFIQYIDSTCNGLISDGNNCIVFSDNTSNEVGTFSLAQAASTYVGQYYSVQFQYQVSAFNIVPGQISAFSCTAGSTSFNIPSTVQTGFQTFSGGFIATASTTTFTCFTK